MRPLRVTGALAWLTGILLTARGATTAGPARAQEILRLAGVKGGLVVHIGCGDGRTTAALRANGSYVVHGLDRDPANVRQARATIRGPGLCGSVSVARLQGDTLPYVDGSVNLLVAEDAQGIPRAEIDRVLAPLGVVCTRSGEGWERSVKPWPQGIDEWTHYLHDSTNNAVAQDTVVGPPRHVQWIGTPHWLRHHDHMSGFSAMVSARGRIFYVVDMGPRWSVQMPPKWTLFARDAFSGVVLWQRPITKWYAHLWSLKKGPAEIMRRLVAVEDTVCVTLGVGAPVTALDAATGRTVRTYAGTEGAEEMIVSGGVLFAVVNPERDAYKALPKDSVDAVRRRSRTWNWDEKPRRLVALEVASGRTLWGRQSRVAPGTLAAAGQRLYLHDGDSVVSLQAETGQKLWASKPIARWKPMHVLFSPTLVVHDDVILFAGGEKMDPLRGGQDTMTALSAQNGAVLWTAPHPDSGYASAEDLFVIDGLAWCGSTTNTRSSGVFTGRDLHTGEVRSEFPPDDWQPHMSHHRCHRAKATSNYILTSRTGIEFVDLRRKHWTPHHWVRGSCNYGVMPCNGLVYAPPHSCGCYPLAKLNSFNALAASSPSRRVPVGVPDAGRLQKGEAYGDVTGGPGEPRDWPTYRGNPRRSGSTPTVVPTELRQTWTLEVGDRLSSVVVAENRVFVADVDRHAVHAINATTGERLWQVTVGGRVDSPPTIWRGRALFGCSDGFVYCLRAADGALAWRFRAAPVDRRLMAHGQLESAWPVHGSVLVHHDHRTGKAIVYCVAGRAMWLDGGLRLLRLDAETGEKVSETVLDDKYPGTDRNLQWKLRWPNLPTTLPDVLSSDGRHVYMRAQPFDLNGKRTEVFTPRNYTEQRGETAHLFSPTGFLDDAWWHRSYWLWGRSVIGGAGGWHLATYQAPAGRILAVGEESVYGFGRVPLKVGGTPNSYHLFACSKEPEIINPNPKRPPRRIGRSVYGEVYATKLAYHWSHGIPFLVRAMVVADQTFFVAGPPEMVAEPDVYGQYGDPDIQARMAEHVDAFEGGKGGVLMAVSKTDGKRLAAYRLDSAPVFDGMAAAAGKLLMATLDGRVLCFGASGGSSLTPAPDVQPGSPPTGVPTFVGTKQHPDFQRLSQIKVRSSELGYLVETATGLYGVAARKLAAPRSGKVTLRVEVRARPGSPPGTMGNAFLVFGNGPEDGKLMSCGFRISGQALYLSQPPFPGGKTVTRKVKVNLVANTVADMVVSLDPGTQKATFTMNDTVVEMDLRLELGPIGWVGYAVSGVDAEFGPLRVEGE